MRTTPLPLLLASLESTLSLKGRGEDSLAGTAALPRIPFLLLGARRRSARIGSCDRFSSAEPVGGIEALHGAAARRARRLRARGLLQLPLADDPPFRAETERYGHYSVAGESSTTIRSMGQQAHRPDLARVGGTLLRRLAPRCTSTIRATWCLSRTCRAIRGSRSPGGQRFIHRTQVRGAAHVGPPYTDDDIKGAKAELAIRQRQGHRW